MPEFFHITNITDVLSIFGFLIALLMFIPWLKQYQEITKQIFSLQNLKYLFLAIGIVLLFNEQLLYTIIVILFWWACSVTIFFRKKEKKISELKGSVFTLILDTIVSIFFIATYLVANTYNHIEKLYDYQIDNTLQHMEQSEKIRDIKKDKE